MPSTYEPFKFMIEAPGAFVCLGLILAGMNYLNMWQIKKKATDPEIICAAEYVVPAVAEPATAEK